jgi:DNA-binding transcriptional ArsR family regulator
VDERLAKALSHPLRAQILTILNERVASPNAISEQLGQRLPNVSYHVRALLDLECIELVSTAQRRGAIEHYYRAVKRPFFTDADWAQLPASARQTVADRTLQLIWHDVSAAISGGTLEARTDRHLTIRALALDEQGWRELSRALQQLLETTEQIETQARGRLALEEEGSVAARLVLMSFEASDES